MNPPVSPAPYGWTLDAWREHTTEIRRLEAVIEAERDRRYAEVNLEREKALKIKETADLAALELAREIQTYKDEKANNLRAQIEGERGNYVSRADLSALGLRVDTALAPLTEYVTAQRGGSASSARNVYLWLAVLGAASTALTIIMVVFVLLGK